MRPQWSSSYLLESLFPGCQDTAVALCTSPVCTEGLHGARGFSGPDSQLQRGHSGDPGPAGPPARPAPPRATRPPLEESPSREESPSSAARSCLLPGALSVLAAVASLVLNPWPAFSLEGLRKCLVFFFCFFFLLFFDIFVNSTLYPVNQVVWNIILTF